MRLYVSGISSVIRVLTETPETTYRRSRVAFNRAVVKAHREVGRNFRGALKSRTGQLRRSISFEVTGDSLATLSGNISSNSIYAPIHEYGGTIKAKDKYTGLDGKPYLNIPLDANKTAAGVMRLSAYQVFEGGGFIIKSKRGKWLVMSGEGVPMFVLIEQVHITARLGMRDAMANATDELIKELRGF